MSHSCLLFNLFFIIYGVRDLCILMLTNPENFKISPEGSSQLAYLIYLYDAVGSIPICLCDSLIGLGSACLLIGHEVAGSIPGTSTI